MYTLHQLQVDLQKSIVLISNIELLFLEG